MDHKVKFDLHTHHNRCGHAEGYIEPYIQAAIQEGLGVIGISDHSPYFASDVDHLHPNLTMAKSQFPEYVKEILHLKEKYADRIEVLLGVESDFFSENMDVYKAIYDQYPFDYIIGSVHYSGGVSIFNRDRWKSLSAAEQVRHKEEYYDLIQKSARSGMFQILGHIDAMKGIYPAFSDIQTDAVEKTLQVIGECDIAIEINTSGKTKDVGGWYPTDSILEMALHYGVQVTFGSDAHTPSRVGDEWEMVAKKLKEIGFKQWVYFKQKERKYVTL